MALYSEVTEENIQELVNKFYDKVRKDAHLAPIFQQTIGEAWDSHLPRMYDFWSSVMLKTGRFNGRPVPKHMAIEGLHADLFKIWLELFHTTVYELYTDEIAQRYVIKSENIAESLQLAVFRAQNLEKLVRPCPIS